MAFFSSKTSKNCEAYDTIDTTLFVAKPIKTLPTGMKSVIFKYDNRSLRSQTPQMPQAFELNENKSDSGRISYSTNLSFRYDGEDEKVGAFREFLEAIDLFNVDYATKNSAELFGKKMKKDIIEEFHKPIVKWPKNDQYRPTIKVKLPFRDGIPDFQVYDRKKNQFEIYDSETTDTTLDMFSSHVKSVYLLEYTGIWVIGKQFGAGWKLVQAKLYNEPELQGCAIIDDSDDEAVVDDDDDTGEDGPAKVDDEDAAEDSEF